MRLLARKLYYLPIDIYEGLAGKRHPLAPKKGDIYIGAGDFIEQGQHQLQLLKSYIDLRPTDRVLDVGSGIGRTAVALTQYIQSPGTYNGFDVVEKGVGWCQEKITSSFPDFHFVYIPLKNDLYNTSKQEAKNFRFPYDDDSFDKVFLFSVFTHMAVDEIAHYLQEIKRVLKPGGLCLSTFFIYNSSTESLISTTNHFSFPIKKSNYRLMSDEVQSANIALSEDLLNELIEKAGLKKINSIEGYWKDTISKSPGLDFQDIVIIEA